MQRSPSERLKDAGDLARRTNVQLLVLASGLLLIWAVNLEDGYARIRTNIVRLAEAEVRQTNLTTALRSRVDQRSRLIEQARQNAQVSHSPDHSRAVQHLDQQIKSASQAEQAAKNLVAQTTETLKTRINFELGQGVKLPFSFQWASLVWLVILATILLRIRVQRDKFWRLVGDALAGTEPSAQIDAQLYDMPFWLAPLPRTRPADPVLRRQLAQTVGWTGTVIWRAALVWALGLALAAVIGRVAWIGLIVNGVAQDRLNAPLLTSAALITMVIVAVGLLGCMCVPTFAKPAIAAHSSFLRRRRGLLGAGLGGMLLFVAWRKPALGYYGRIKKSTTDLVRSRFRRYKARHARTANLSAAQLPAGFYANRRSGKLYYVPLDGIVRNGGDRLKAANLRSANPVTSDSVRRGQLGPVLDGFEQRALELVGRGKPDAAVLLLINVAKTRYAVDAQPRAKPVLKQLDLAAGLAIRYGLRERLRDVVRLTQQMQRHAPTPRERQLLATRIDRWTKQRYVRWRHTRWRSQPHPLRWNGRRYDMI